MVTWIWIAVGFVVVNVVSVVLLERRSRELQWQKFTAAIRSVDGRCRTVGWILVDASFRPGWREGHGLAVWRRGRDTFRSPVTIDAIATTREAAHPW